MRTLLSAALIFGAMTAHADPVETLQGASKIEREIRWLWKYLPEFINSCLESDDECRKPDIMPTLERLSGLTTKADHLKFVAESSGLFHGGQNDAHRVAVTELRMGAPVFINTDRLNMDHIRWSGILVHEAVHQLGLPDDQQRLPDRVGAAVAAFLERAIMRGDLAEFGHADAEFLMFSPPKPNRLGHYLIHILDVSIDNEMKPNPRSPICARGEAFKGQTIQAPLWRVLYLNGARGQVKIQGSSVMANACAGPNGVRMVPALFETMMDLQFPNAFDPKSAWWEAPSKIDPTTIIAGVQDDIEHLEFDLGRSFAVKHVTYSADRLRAGQTWKAQVLLQSLDDFKPENCFGALSGTKWHYNRTRNLSWFQPFESCALKDLGGGQWQIDLSFTFAAAAQPDHFWLNFIQLVGQGTKRYAFSAKPKMLELVSPTASAALKVKSWNVSGLEPLTELLGQPLVHSFRIRPEQKFWLEFQLEGLQSIDTQFFDFDFIVQSPEGAGHVLMPWNAHLDKLKGSMILQSEDKPIPGGKLLRYQMVLPRHMGDVKVVGFKLRRVSLGTSDFSWAEFTLPNFLEGLFLTEF